MAEESLLENWGSIHTSQRASMAHLGVKYVRGTLWDLPRLQWRRLTALTIHHACSASAGTAAGCSRRSRSCRSASRCRLSCSIFSACAHGGAGGHACILGQHMGSTIGLVDWDCMFLGTTAVVQHLPHAQHAQIVQLRGMAGHGHWKPASRSTEGQPHFFQCAAMRRRPCRTWIRARRRPTHVQAV